MELLYLFSLILSPMLLAAAQSTSDYSHQHQLYDHLMSSYVRELRPVPLDDMNSSSKQAPLDDSKLAALDDSKLVVSVDMQIRSVLSVEESVQKVRLAAWMSLYWRDDRLTWDPAHFGNTTHLTLTRDVIWIPDISLYNGDTRLDSFHTPFYVHVTSSGHIHCPYRATYRVTCELHVAYFPFDHQSCVLTFASYINGQSRLKLEPLVECGKMELVRQQEEWTLITYLARTNHSALPTSPEQQAEVQYQFLLRRKPLYYLLNLGFPSLLAITLALVGFFTPSDTTGERTQKVQMGLTTLMNMTLLLLVVSKHIPATSQTVPLISTYYCISMFIICLATSITAILLSVQSNANDMKPIPQWLKILAFRWMVQVLGTHIPLRELAPDETPVAPGHTQTGNIPVKINNGGLKASPMRRSNTREQLATTGQLSHRRSNQLETIPEVQSSKTFSNLQASGAAPHKEVAFHATQCPEPLPAAAMKYTKKLTPNQVIAKNLMRTLGTCVDTNEAINKQRDKHRNWKKNRYEWQCAVDVIERFLLVVFLTITLSFSFVVLGYGMKDGVKESEIDVELYKPCVADGIL